MKHKIMGGNMDVPVDVCCTWEKWQKMAARWIKVGWLALWLAGEKSSEGENAGSCKCIIKPSASVFCMAAILHT